ncbi:hypothetical protein AN416_22200 [Paraburkholderia caribensis]|nr:hypothetical protein AN416_22200 [Paraburkholderia caribensis]
MYRGDVFREEAAARQSSLDSRQSRSTRTSRSVNASSQPNDGSDAAASSPISATPSRYGGSTRQ